MSLAGRVVLVSLGVVLFARVGRADQQVIAPGTAPVQLGSDDVLVLTPVGSAAPNSAVIQCGPNLVADTTANNVTPGDDVQVIPVGNACASANDVVVDSGADGIATTRAEGPDL